MGKKVQIEIPQQIRVGGHAYKVVYRPYLSKDLGNRGSIEHRQQLIYIEPENPPSQRNATILHEIIHFINTIFAMDLSDDNVDRLSEGLYQVLSDSFGIEFVWDKIKEEDTGSKEA